MQITFNLRKSGKEVGVSESIDAVSALNLIDIIDLELFKAILNATLIKDNAARFEISVKPSEEKLGGPSNDLIRRDQFASIVTLGAESPIEETKLTNLYSPLETTQTQPDARDRTMVTNRKVWQDGLRRFVQSIATLESHRKMQETSGSVNIRRTIRMDARRAGESALLVRTSERINKAKVVLLCDVSGSMMRAVTFISNLAYWTKRSMPKSEIFLFSTRITRVTKYADKLGSSRFESFISRFGKGYGGGTRIGQCFDQLIRRYGNMLDKKTTTVIFSDGWDIGEIDLLDSKMRELSVKCHKVVWINPLLEEVDYLPESMGIQTALPYIDSFLSPSEFILGTSASNVNKDKLEIEVYLNPP